MIFQTAQKKPFYVARFPQEQSKNVENAPLSSSPYLRMSDIYLKYSYWSLHL